MPRSWNVRRAAEGSRLAQEPEVPPHEARVPRLEVPDDLAFLVVRPAEARPLPHAIVDELEGHLPLGDRHAIRRALELAEERLERHGLPEALEEGGAQEPLGPPPRDDPEEPGRAHDDRDGQLPHPWAKFRR